jgi:hypothetical protein
MIVIKYSKRTKAVEKWEEKLTELVVGFKMEKVENIAEPILIENDTKFAGEAKIQAFVDELERIVGEWRTPRCGV